MISEKGVVIFLLKKYKKIYYGSSQGKSKISDHYKIKNNVPVIVGGGLATFAPDIVSKEKLVDLVCVGEGENALIDLCNKIQNNQDYSDVTNCWIKKDGKVIKKSENLNLLIDRTSWNRLKLIK